MKRFVVVVSLVALSACSGTSSQELPTAGKPGQATSTTSTTAPPSGDQLAAADAEDNRSELADMTRPIGSALIQPAGDSKPRPAGLAIESLGIVDASVIDVGVEENGEMEIPGAAQVGWYRYGPSPGEPGSAVLAAHIAFNGRDGVFRDLQRIEVGDVVEVFYDDGSSKRFRIAETAQYDKDELPVDRIFAKEGAPELTLITCGGDFNRSLRSYSDNVVAYAEPIDT